MITLEVSVHSLKELLHVMQGDKPETAGCSAVCNRKDQKQPQCPSTGEWISMIIIMQWNILQKLPKISLIKKKNENNKLQNDEGVHTTQSLFSITTDKNF